MITPMNLRGCWVLVTGASSGLGHEMARVLARDHGANLLLAARREERLAALVKELTAAHGVEAVAVPTDLTRAADVDRLVDACTTGRQLHAAVLNAGVAWHGAHVDLPGEVFATMLATNVTSLVHLTGKLLPHLEAAGGGGGLLLVSSLGGVMPMPYQAAYGATKAFVTHLGLDLREELRGKSVSVSVFAPGGIATEMVTNTGLDARYPEGSVWLMAADRCARLGVRTLVRRKAYVVAGLLNRIGSFLLRVLPRPLLARAMAKAYRVDQGA